MKSQKVVFQENSRESFFPFLIWSILAFFYYYYFQYLHLLLFLTSTEPVDNSIKQVTTWTFCGMACGEPLHSSPLTTALLLS